MEAIVCVHLIRLWTVAMETIVFVFTELRLWTMAMETIVCVH